MQEGDIYIKRITKQLKQPYNTIIFMFLIVQLIIN